MKYAIWGARIVLGLIFVIFGLNGFLNFIPMGEPAPVAQGFLGALGRSGYFFPLLKGTEILTGALLLSGLFVPLALVVLAPIVIQIALFHGFLAPEGLPMGLALVALTGFLAYGYREHFRSLMTAR